MSQTALAALEDTREQKQAILNSFFHAVHYSPEDLGEISLSTFFPINFPAPVKTKLPGKYMDRFWQQLGDSRRRVISNHFSASAENAGLLQRLPHDVLTVSSAWRTHCHPLIFCKCSSSLTLHLQLMDLVGQAILSTPPPKSTHSWMTSFQSLAFNALSSTWVTEIR